jgi:hypothetical protein
LESKGRDLIEVEYKAGIFISIHNLG